MTHKRLNLGSGNDIREGWVNLDKFPLKGVDIVHDLEKLPLPFQNEEFDEVLCQDILEHLDYIPLLKEIHRILKTGGKLTVRVPHFSSKNNFIDPTHRKMFSINTFSFFTMGHFSKARGYYFDFHFGEISSTKITFEKSSRFFWYNSIVEKLVNYHPRFQFLYESTMFSRLFPAMNIVVEMKK
ncbi:MAG TPA: class I SAM-dependent methyltransferase [Candidatus Paceibacterota bacterium]